MPTKITLAMEHRASATTSVVVKERVDVVVKAVNAASKNKLPFVTMHDAENDKESSIDTRLVKNIKEE